MFSDPVTYDIFYRTDASEEWLPLAEGIDGALNRHISLDRIGIPEGQRITELCWRFGTVPAGFSIGEEAPEYWMETDADTESGTRLVNQIRAEGLWRL